MRPALPVLLFCCLGLLPWGCSAESNGPAGSGPTGGAGPVAGVGPGGSGGTGASGAGGSSGASGGGGASGGSSGGGTSGGDSGDNCGEARLDPVVEVTPGNLMVIFDRSMSMGSLCGLTPSGVTRLQAAYQALLDALGPFVCAPAEPDAEPCSETLTVASILLPSAPNVPGLCYVEDINSPQNIPWMSATDFVAAWQAYFTGPGPAPDESHLVLGTPITPAFQHAADAIQNAGLFGKTAVLFLTDGAGTCLQGTTAEAHAAAWLQQGILTHVVSTAVSDGAQSNPLLCADGGAFNESVAQSGGTAPAINPTDVGELTTALQGIVQSAVGVASCEVPLQGGRLSTLQEACEQGSVTVGGQPVPCDQENRSEGFYLKDVSTMQLVGSACTKLETVGSLSAVFPCELIIIE